MSVRSLGDHLGAQLGNRRRRDLSHAPHGKAQHLSNLGFGHVLDVSEPDHIALVIGEQSHL